MENVTICGKKQDESKDRRVILLLISIDNFKFKKSKSSKI